MLQKFERICTTTITTFRANPIILHIIDRLIERFSLLSIQAFRRAFERIAITTRLSSNPTVVKESVLRKVLTPVRTYVCDRIEWKSNDNFANHCNQSENKPMPKSKSFKIKCYIRLMLFSSSTQLVNFYLSIANRKIVQNSQCCVFVRQKFLLSNRWFTVPPHRTFQTFIAVQVDAKFD